MSEKWRDELVQQITDQIRHQGIEFDAVTIGGDYVVAGNRLSKAITESSLQSVGVLNQLYSLLRHEGRHIADDTLLQ